MPSLEPRVLAKARLASFFCGFMSLVRIDSAWRSRFVDLPDGRCPTDDRVCGPGPFHVRRHGTRQYCLRDSGSARGELEPDFSQGNPAPSQVKRRSSLQLELRKLSSSARNCRGLDTLIGERGQKLSGGQKQRLAIARAIVRQPPILILDEATSAVDNVTERLIQRSIQNLAIGRSLLVIAHRLSTIRRADMIYVLDQGSMLKLGPTKNCWLKRTLRQSMVDTNWKLDISPSPRVPEILAQLAVLNSFLLPFAQVLILYISA